MKRKIIGRISVCLLVLTAMFAGSAAAAGTGKIVIFVYNDNNPKNGIYNSGEPGLANWTVQLFGGNIGWRPVGGIPIGGTSPVLPTPQLVTNETGYNTTVVSPGTYFLAETEQNWVNGWVPSTMPDGMTVKFVTVKEGDVKLLKFAVFCRLQTCASHT